MNDETTNPGRPGLRTKALGAATGAVVVLSGLAGFGILSATAQDAPETEAAPSAETTETERSGLNPFTIEADLDFAAFDACMADELGADWLSATPLGVDGAAGLEDLDDYLDPANWDEIDLDLLESAAEDFELDEEAYEAAAEACESELPEMIAEEVAGLREFEACMEAQGIDHEGDDHDGPSVIVEGEEFQALDFGEDGGSVTITSDGETVTVETDGDVTVHTEDDLDAEFEAMAAELEAAFDACGDELPDFDLDFSMLEGLADFAEGHDRLEGN